MHIIAIHHYAGSSEHGMAFRVYYLAQEWIKAGHTVTIVAASYSHIRRVNPEFTGSYKEEIINGIKYIWVKTRPYGGNGIGRILNMIDFLKGVRKYLSPLAKENPNAVIAMSTYPLDNYLAYKLSKKTDAKYIYEVRDLWPLSPRLLGGYSKWHPFIQVMQIAENFAYKHCDDVVTVLPCAEEYMKEHGLADGKYHHVPNGIYIPEISVKEPLNKDFEDLLPKDKTIIGYCGTIGLANSLNKLVEVAFLLKDSNPELFFAIVGKGPEKENLNNLIEKYKLTNIKIYDAIPKAQVQSFLEICSIIVIIWGDFDLYKYGISPNKIFDYMYSGKPIIQALKAGNDLLREAGCGITCDTTPEAIRDTLIKMLKMSQEELDNMGKNGHEFVIKKHSYDILAKRFLDVLQNDKQ